MANNTSQMNQQSRNCGFDVLSQALDSAKVKIYNVGGFDVAERENWGCESISGSSSCCGSNRSGFDILNQAQEGVLDGEATKEGLLKTNDSPRAPALGFEVLANLQDSHKRPATADGFGLIEQFWSRSGRRLSCKAMGP